MSQPTPTASIGPRVDDNGFVCLTDIRREFGNDPRYAPSLYLQRFRPTPGHTYAQRGAEGGTFATPEIADAYRAYLVKISAKRFVSKRNASEPVPLATLADMAALSLPRMRRMLMEHGLAFPEEFADYKHCHVSATIPARQRKLAVRINGHWQWLPRVLEVMGL